MNAEKSDCMRWEMGDVCVDAGARKITRAGREIALPKLSWDLLLALLRAAPDAVSLDRLMEAVWPGLVINSETVTKRVNLLRQALGDDSQNPRYIEGVRGYGYRIVAPVKPLDGTDIAPDAGAAGSRRRWPVALVLGVAIVLAIGVAMLLFYAVNVRIDSPGEASSGAVPAVDPPPTNSLAVLPFTDMSPAGDQEYFGDGLAEEIIHLLAQIDSLTVIGRTSSFSFKDQKPTIRQIGQVLGVHHILEGSVRKSGDRVRITAQLLHAGNGSHLWSQTYDRQLSDIFLVQTDVALHIAGALEAEITAAERERLARQPTESLEAHTLYLKGRYFWNQRTREGLGRAIEYFEQAIEADPDYARAYAGLASVYAPMGIFGFAHPSEVRPRMRAAAHRAVELDDESAEAHAVLALYLELGEWNWDEAESLYLRAIELDLDYSTAHHWYASSLRARGRFDESVIHARRAVELEPLVAIHYSSLATSLQHLGRPERSFERYRQAIELAPGFWLAHEGLGILYESQGDLEEAIAAFERAAHHSGGLARPKAGLARVLALAGREAEARGILGELRAETGQNDIYTPQVASVLYALGDADAAFEWLEAGYRQRHFNLRNLPRQSGATGLQDDPRFKDLLQRMGLPL